MNRFNNYKLVISPPLELKELINKDLNTDFITSIYKILKKNCNKFIISYEVGTNDNEHLDIVACFKGKQARKDILGKLKNIFTQEELEDKRYINIGKITDLQQRLGYSLKEQINNISEGFTDDELTEASEYYAEWERENNIKKELKDIKTINTTAKAIQYMCNFIKHHKDFDPEMFNKTILISFIKETIQKGVHYDLSINQKRNMSRFLMAYYGKNMTALNYLANEFDYEGVECNVCGTGIQDYN